jgi:hypothetical protein
VLLEQRRDPGIDADRDELLLAALDRILELAADLALGDHDLAHLVLIEERLELAVRELGDLLVAHPRVVQEHHAEEGDDHVDEAEPRLLHHGSLASLVAKPALSSARTS